MVLTLARAQNVGIGALYVAGYVALDWVSYIYPAGPYAITPWNPPPGLSLALLLACGMRFAPLLLIAAVLAELLVRSTAWTSPAETALFAAILATGYTGVAAALRHLRLDRRFQSVRDLMLFTTVVAAGAMAIAVVYVGAHVLAGRIAADAYLDHALQFWVGDVIGILITAPFLLVHVPLATAGRWRIRGEAALQALAIVLVLAFVFSMPGAAAAKFFYFLFLPLVWISTRHGFEGATAALMATQIGLICAVQLRGYAASSVLEFQTLMLALAVTGTFLGMAVSQWRRASHALDAREADLNRAMRLAAATEMASALAHELNQPLTAASNYVQACEIMLREETQLPAVNATIEKARTEVDRATEVVRRLRNFYRGGEARREAVDVRDLFRAALDPLRNRLARHRIDVREQIDSALPHVAVDRVQIEMVLHNLISNAIDAIKSRDSPRRVITLHGAREGSVVRLALADSGPGVGPDIAPQLFQNFSSSKPGGMGLGLAISRSIIESHGGRLWYEPAADGGACFLLTLPATTV